MTFSAKCLALASAQCLMLSSKELCLSDAKRLYEAGRIDDALARLEKGARYAWGFNRPDGWNG